MAKIKLFEWIMWIVGILVAIAIGGQFISGAYLTGIILNWFPEIVHQIIGWIIIGTTILGLIQRVMK